MNEEKLKLIIPNIMSDEQVFDFIKYLLDCSGYTDRSVNFECSNKQYYLLGKKDFGAFIAELIKTYCFKKYAELIRKD